jgi:hypothetical protein
LCARKLKGSIITRPLRRVKNGDEGSSALIGRRKSNRDCREILREAAGRRFDAMVINSETLLQTIGREEGPIGGTAERDSSVDH